MLRNFRVFLVPGWSHCGCGEHGYHISSSYETSTHVHRSRWLSICLCACMCGATENARHENAGPNCRGGKCGKSLYGKPKCEKVSQSSCICVQSYSFSISLQTYATRGVPYYRVSRIFMSRIFSVPVCVCVCVCVGDLLFYNSQSHIAVHAACLRISRAVHFTKMYLYSSIGNGQRRQPALCRHTFLVGVA